MTSSPSPHARAVALFGALAERPVRELCQRPADLIRPLGRAAATGYRMVAEAEAVGLLQRDAQQHYRLGMLARRVGLSALGFGDLADLADPVLTDLREALRLTTVLAVAQDGDLRVGPYSLGRGTDYVRPEPRYAVIAHDTLDAVQDLALRPIDRSSREIWLHGACVRQAADRVCLVGVLTPGRWPERQAAWHVELTRAAQQLADGSGPA